MIQMRLRNAESERRSRAVASKELISKEVEDEEGLGIDSDALAWDSRGRFARYLTAPQWFCGVVNGCTELATPLLRPLLVKAAAERPTDLPRWLAEQALAMSMMLNSSPENMIQVPKSPQPCDINQLYSISHRAFHKQVTGDLFRFAALSCSPVNAGWWNRRLGRVVVTSPSC